MLYHTSNLCIKIAPSLSSYFTNQQQKRRGSGKDSILTIDLLSSHSNFITAGMSKDHPKNGSQDVQQHSGNIWGHLGTLSNHLNEKNDLNQNTDLYQQLGGDFYELAKQNLNVPLEMGNTGNLHINPNFNEEEYKKRQGHLKAEHNALKSLKNQKQSEALNAQDSHKSV